MSCCRRARFGASSRELAPCSFCAMAGHPHGIASNLVLLSSASSMPSQPFHAMNHPEVQWARFLRQPVSHVVVRSIRKIGSSVRFTSRHMLSLWFNATPLPAKHENGNKKKSPGSMHPVSAKFAHHAVPAIRARCC